ncbi:MAG: N-acetylneuraminate synthase, partial [Methanobacterium sp.]
GNKIIGEGYKNFIIAEAGVNHNGSFKQAKRLIDAAKDINADAIKFQTFKAGKVTTKNAEKASYQKNTTGDDESQYEMIKKLELSYNDFRRLHKYAIKKDIIFLSSPFDNESADFLDDLNLPAFKISSGEIDNFPFLEHIAKKGKPIILSTGMSNLCEIEKSLNIIKKEGVKDIILLHCVSNYPAKFENLNLNAIKTLRKSFKLNVGFSDHSIGITAPIIAVGLGTCIIEKHFTIDKNLPGPDHKASLDTEEFMNMVDLIRQSEKALGDGIKKITHDEVEIKRIARRSIVAKVNIEANAVIKKEMLDFKRPGIGISPKYIECILGKRARNKIVKDELITLDRIL